MVLLALVLRGSLARCWTGEGCARAVAHRDEEGGDVLAVLAGFLESRTGAVRGDALAAELDGDRVRIRIGAAHLALGGRVVHVDVFDDLAFLVVEPAQEGSRPEQAAQSAIGQCGKGVS